MRLVPRFGCFLATIGCVFALSAADPVLISPPPALAPAAAGPTFGMQISPDGRFVLFTSADPTLTTNRTSGKHLDLYLQDRLTGDVELISTSSSGTGGANSSIEQAFMSDDGRFIVFETTATNITGVEAMNFPTLDVFLRDRVDGATMLVSKGTDGKTARGNSRESRISRDGAVIVFNSDASGLVAGDNNTAPDIYAYHTATKQLERVTVPIKGLPTSINGVALSANGRMVAFSGSGTNMFTGQSTFSAEIYARDLVDKKTYLVSTNARAVLGSSPTETLTTDSAVVSEDGARIYFRAQTTTKKPQILLWERDTGIARRVGDVDASETLRIACIRNPQDGSETLAYVATNRLLVHKIGAEPIVLTTWTNTGVAANVARVFNPILSANGDVVTFLSNYAHREGTNGPAGFHISHWDVSGQKRLLIGQTTDSPGEPMLNGVTADGRFILFSANTPGSSPAGAPAAPQAHLLDTDSKGIQGVGQSTQTTKTPFGHLLMTSRAVSADGRYVAFSTTHPHSPLDTNGVLDVYVRDVVEKRTILASASTNQAGSGASFDAVISPTGRHVAFLSATNNFTSATSTNRLGLYVKNLETAAVMMVDEPLQGGNSETLPGTYSFSADGNWIAYETKVGFAYLMNLATGERIGLMNNAAGETRGKAFLPTFSPDGGSVYFYSTAPDLVEPSQLGYFLFKRDLATGQVTRLATLIDSPATGRPAQLAFSVSTNGVMLLSTSNTIWRVEPGDTNRVQICSSCDQPALSPDGSAIVYRSVLGSSMKARLPDDRVITLPTISGGNINIPAGPGRDPVFSGDGAQVAYTVQRSGSGASIVHLYHFSSGKLEVPLPDQTNTNDPRNHVVNPNFTADGGKLYVLGSAALTEDDRNGTSDIFMLDLRADTIDSDQDGMPDAWEVTFFGNLLQGASDDFDQDGLSNLAEHRAGTSPSNAADVLQVVIFESLLEPRRVLRWRSKPGMRYVVEAKDRLDDAWRQVSLPITATGTTGFYQEEELQAESKHRFYRIRLVP